PGRDGLPPGASAAGARLPHPPGARRGGGDGVRDGCAGLPAPAVALAEGAVDPRPPLRRLARDGAGRASLRDRGGVRAAAVPGARAGAGGVGALGDGAGARAAAPSAPASPLADRGGRASLALDLAVVGGLRAARPAAARLRRARRRAARGGAPLVARGPPAAP